MRRITLSLLATAAVFGLTAGAATAADLPRKAPAPVVAPPPPPYNWTGFYVGGFLGAGWVRNDVDSAIRLSDDFFFPSNGRSFSNGVGPLGGVTVGYNWQWPATPIVLGIEGDFAWASLKGDTSRNVTDTFGTTFIAGVDPLRLGSIQTVANASSRTSFDVQDIATITGRFGLISGPQDRTLWYVKGGGAWARTKVNASAQFNEVACVTALGNSACVSDSIAGSFTEKFSRWGWTVGTGLEFGLWDRWTGKVEYDYLSFGSRDFNRNITCADCSFDFLNVNAHVKEQIHVVKIGLNYRFGWGLGKAPYAPY